MANPPGAFEVLQTNFIPIMGVWVGVAVGFHYILPILKPTWEHRSWPMSFHIAVPFMLATWFYYGGKI